MHDLVIRGGTLVDGTGAPACVGDLAIDGDRIVAVGGRAGPGREEIDARDRIVAPGWIDIHTHYDGQVMWDPYLSPSSQHGVSTVVMGHCGVGFAPVREQHRELMVRVMEGLEDIPGATLRAGLRWNWESFPDYLDVLAQMPRVLDIGTQVPHSALRVYAMGDRGARKEPAAAEDIERMGALLEESLRAGALGFSSSRSRIHTTSDGHHIPGSFADDNELLGIGRAMARAGHGVFEFFSDMDVPEREFDWMTRLSRDCGVPVHFIVAQLDGSLKYRELLDRTERAAQAGADISALVACRPVGMLMTLDSEYHPFSHHPSYLAIAQLPLPMRLRILRDPAFKQKILGETSSNNHGFWGKRMQQFDGMFRLGDPPDYEPPAQRSLAAIAAREGRSPLEVAYDLMQENHGEEVIYFPFFNYAGGNFDVLEEMLLHPRSLVSLADGGAHCGIMCDAGAPTFLLTHWVRDRRRGPRLGLEQAVQMQTARNAAAYGLHDRGRLAPGLKADVNVIDLERLQLETPYWVRDLPANGRRLVQYARGYDVNVVSGVVTARHGEFTGALPGKLIRGPQPAGAKV